jgi:hypothetical protein
VAAAPENSPAAAAAAAPDSGHDGPVLGLGVMGDINTSLGRVTAELIRNAWLEIRPEMSAAGLAGCGTVGRTRIVTSVLVGWHW